MTKEQELCNYLMAKHVGQDKAIHSKKLEKRFDICPRTVRTYVNNLRKAGIPICSDDSGYWIAANPREVNKTVKRLGDFAGEVNNARTGLAYATIQMRSVMKVTEERVQIIVKVS